MDEREVPKDSSEEISNDKSPSKEGVQPAASHAGHQKSKSVQEQQSQEAKNRPESNEAGILMTPEELPTMQWSDVYAELAEFEKGQVDEARQDQASHENRTPAQTGPIEGLEEAMNWLEELAAGQGIPIDEMPTLITDQPQQDSSSKKSGSSKPRPKSEPDTRAIPVDSDPMAWLEQLAVDQSSPLEELPSVADRLLASEIVSQNEIPPSSTINDPYDIDRALTYLEQLAIAQGIDLNKVSFDANQPVTSLNSALAIIDELAVIGLAQKHDASPEDDDADDEVVESAPRENGQADEAPSVDNWSDMASHMPDDPQQALDWLGLIDKEQDSTKMDIVVEGDTKATESKNEAPIDTDVLGEMPEDPDEAIAWMEELAAREFQNLDDEADTPTVVIPDPTELEEANSPPSEAPPKTQVNSTEDIEQTIIKYQSLINQESITAEDVAALEEINEKQENSPKILRLLGDAYMQLGDTDKAIATYRRAFDHL